MVAQDDDIFGAYYFNEPTKSSLICEKSLNLVTLFQGHEGAINCMTVVDDKLYTGSSDGTLRVWDAKDIR